MADEAAPFVARVWRGGLGDGHRLERVENQAATFAAVDFFVGFGFQELLDVRKDAEAAAFALAFAGFGERGAVVALGDAVVEGAHVFGDRGDDALAFGQQGLQRFLLFGVEGEDLLFLGVDRFFGFAEVGFGVFHARLGVFRAHHHFELAVFGFGGFGFGVGDFVLESFVGFVGFDGAGLVAVFAGAFFPLEDVEFEFLALGEAGGVGFLGGGDGGAGGG